MTKGNNLKNYKEKRGQKSPEPKGKKKSSEGKKNVFVIQKHDASNLHYDFRLEIDGVLKSWAIPKGPSVNPKDKRLAIKTEDHPLDYRKFEGSIPEGEYGAGEVIIWDEGKYENLKEEKYSMKEAYEKGKIEVKLHGKKLKGGFALIQSDKKRWMLIKMDDDEANARKKPVKSEPKSVKSGKTIKDLKKE